MTRSAFLTLVLLIFTNRVTGEQQLVNLTDEKELLAINELVRLTSLHLTASYTFAIEKWNRSTPAIDTNWKQHIVDLTFPLATKYRANTSELIDFMTDQMRGAFLFEVAIQTELWRLGLDAVNEIYIDFKQSNFTYAWSIVRRVRESLVRAFIVLRATRENENCIDKVTQALISANVTKRNDYFRIALQRALVPFCKILHPNHNHSEPISIEI